jgi:hypothetical protein
MPNGLSVCRIHASILEGGLARRTVSSPCTEKNKYLQLAVLLFQLRICPSLKVWSSLHACLGTLLTKDVSLAMAGVNMRLEAGAIRYAQKTSEHQIDPIILFLHRELHWHSAAEVSRYAFIECMTFNVWALVGICSPGIFV